MTMTVDQALEYGEWWAVESGMEGSKPAEAFDVLIAELRRLRAIPAGMDAAVDAASKAIADVIGHGQREKCDRHAMAAITAALPHLFADYEAMKRDAERWNVAIRLLSSGHIPGPGYGRRIKLVETCPVYGEEKQVTGFQAIVDDTAMQARGEEG